MLFKSFSHISRHASLAKNLWTSSSNPSSQPSFFVSTSQLARHQSQVATRKQPGFGTQNGEDKKNNNAHSSSAAAGGLVSSSSFTNLTPLTSLDEERQREMLLVADSSGVHHKLLNTNGRKLRGTQNTSRQFSTSVEVRRKNDDELDEEHAVMQEFGPELEGEKELSSGEVDQSKAELKQTEYVDSTVSQVRALLGNQKYYEVLDVFDGVREHGTKPNVEIYNAALRAILELCRARDYELSPMLDVYGQMLQDSVKPDVSTYSVIIEGLLDAAEFRGSGDKFLFGNRGVLPTIDTQIERMEEAAQYITLALQIFDASNSAKLQNYNVSIYARLLDACVKHESDKVPNVLEAIEHVGLEVDPDLMGRVIRAYGKAGDMNSALTLRSKVETPSDKVNAALIAAHFDNLDALGAVSFFEKLLDSSAFGEALSAVVKGFAKIGDGESAMNWIVRAEQDDSIPPIPYATLKEAFDDICKHDDVTVADKLFDYLASANGFNDNEMRSQYMQMCLRNDSNIDKAIKECQVHGGLWDPATIVRVVEYLARCGDPESVCQIFIAQSNRLKQYADVESVGDELMEAVVKVMRPLDLQSALTLASSPLVNLAAMNRGVVVELLEAIWNGKHQYKQMQSMSRLVTLDIVVFHNMLVSNSGIELPDELKLHYNEYVNDLIQQGTQVEESFAQEVKQCLETLGLNTEQWDAFVTQGTLLPDFRPLSFNAEASNKCIAYAQTQDGQYKAYDILEHTLLKGDLIAPEAVLAVLDFGGTKDFEILTNTYRLLLDNLPHPSTSPQAWDFWVSIHRSVVQHAAEKDIKLAQTAYANLTDMGSCPDATGYAQLISHAQVTNTRDEASDAVQLFNESRMYNVHPNTFLYNVLLSKLAKARRLREAMAFYDEMAATNTVKSSITYGTMISACCRAGDEANAKRLFDEMEMCPNYVPKVAPFNIMLQYYIHTKRDRQAALDMYHRLRAAGVAASSHTYKLVIDMYSTIAPIDIAAADNVLHQILKDQNRITTQHFAALIFARGVGMQDLASAREFYDSLLEHRRVRPDKLVFQALLESYVVNNAIEHTGAVLQDMLRFQVDLNAYMANILIRGWAPVNLAKSVGLFDYMLACHQAEPSSFEAMIRAFMYHGDLVSAQNVLETMRSKSYPEPVVAKVAALLESSSPPQSSHNGQQVLLDSIFRQDAHRLV